MANRKNKHAGRFALLGLLLVVPFAVWNGFVVSKLWAWFVSPLGVRHIGIWEAAGLYLFARLLTLDTTLPRDDEKGPAEKFTAAVVMGILMPALCLAFAAIYHGLAS